MSGVPSGAFDDADETPLSQLVKGPAQKDSGNTGKKDKSAKKEKKDNDKSKKDKDKAKDNSSKETKDKDTSSKETKGKDMASKASGAKVSGEKRQKEPKEMAAQHGEPDPKKGKPSAEVESGKSSQPDPVTALPSLPKQITFKEALTRSSVCKNDVDVEMEKPEEPDDEEAQWQLTPTDTQMQMQDAAAGGQQFMEHELDESGNPPPNSQPPEPWFSPSLPSEPEAEPTAPRAEPKAESAEPLSEPRAESTTPPKEAVSAEPPEPKAEFTTPPKAESAEPPSECRDEPTTPPKAETAEPQADDSAVEDTTHAVDTQVALVQKRVPSVQDLFGESSGSDGPSAFVLRALAELKDAGLITTDSDHEDTQGRTRFGK